MFFAIDINEYESVVAEISGSISLNCSLSSINNLSNATIQWIKVISLIKYNVEEKGNTILFGNNGQVLNLNNLQTTDNGYYACGILNNMSDFNILSEYNLIIKRKFKFQESKIICFLFSNQNTLYIPVEK